MGLAIAKAFTRAGALRIIITGRRSAVLADAEAQIHAVAKQAGKTVAVLARPFDVTDKAAVASLWDNLKQQGIEVDVLVQNAAKLTAGSFGLILDSAVDAIWEMFETNVHGPLMMAAAFHKQNIETQKVNPPARPGPHVQAVAGNI